MSDNQTPPETLADPAVISEGTSKAPFADVNDGPAPVPCFLCKDTGEVHEQVTPQCIATKACPACRPE